MRHRAQTYKHFLKPKIYGTCLIILATQETEVGGYQFQGQPQQLSETLSQKKKEKKGVCVLGLYLSGKTPLGSIPSTKNKNKNVMLLGMVAHIYNPSGSGG